MPVVISGLLVEDCIQVQGRRRAHQYLEALARRIPRVRESPECVDTRTAKNGGFESCRGRCGKRPNRSRPGPLRGSDHL
jgi:hypothetical protein